jgi:hypothetical protein
LVYSMLIYIIYFSSYNILYPYTRIRSAKN